MNINIGPYKCIRCGEYKAFMRELRISKNMNITVKIKCIGCGVIQEPSIKDQVWEQMGYPVEPLKSNIRIMMHKIKRHYGLVMGENIDFEF